MYKPPVVKAKFQPTLGQKYFFVGDIPGNPPNASSYVLTRHWRGSNADKARAARGNVFSTFKGAQTVRKALNAALAKAA
jgi:hypothetical protein